MAIVLADEKVHSSAYTIDQSTRALLKRAHVQRQTAEASPPRTGTVTDYRLVDSLDLFVYIDKSPSHPGADVIIAMVVNTIGMPLVTNATQRRFAEGSMDE